MDTLVRGAPLAQERLGALTLGGYLREVCEKYAGNEALVFHPPSGPVVRRSYAEVWDEAHAIARALVARGVTKETRVGVLATNRPEWVTAMFGVSLAGGTAVLLSSFAKGAELEYLLRVADVSLLIFERSVLNRDFAAEIGEFCPELASAHGDVHAPRLPFLRRAVCIGEMDGLGGAIESWQEFVNGERKAPAAVVDAIAAEVAPSDRGVVFFSSGSTAKPKGVVHTHRAATIQCGAGRACTRSRPACAPGRPTASSGRAISRRRSARHVSRSAARLVLQRYFDPGEALRPDAGRSASRCRSRGRTSGSSWPRRRSTRWTLAPALRRRDLAAAQPPTVTTRSGRSRCRPTATPRPYLQRRPIRRAPARHRRRQLRHALPGKTFKIVDPLTGAALAARRDRRDRRQGPDADGGLSGHRARRGVRRGRLLPYRRWRLLDAEGRLYWHGRLNDIIKTGGANVSPIEIDASCASARA